MVRLSAVGSFALQSLIVQLFAAQALAVLGSVARLLVSAKLQKPSRPPVQRTACSWISPPVSPLFEQAACWHDNNVSGFKHSIALDAAARAVVIVGICVHHACFSVSPAQFYALASREIGQAAGLGQNLKNGCTLGRKVLSGYVDLTHYENFDRRAGWGECSQQWRGRKRCDRDKYGRWRIEIRR